MKNFRKRVRRYGDIFKKFLQGEIDRGELIDGMAEADNKEIDDGNLFYEVQMIDLQTKGGKTARLVPVD